MSKDLLLEIGTEEIPAGFVPRGMRSMEETLAKRLEAARLEFTGMRTFGTPRRLAVVVEGLVEKQPDSTDEVKGPRLSAAYDAEGKPTKALEGFMRSQGVGPDEVKTARTDKGEYVYIVKHSKGAPTEEILPGILAETVSLDCFAKSMRWGAHDITFARPVHWMVALYGGKTVPFSYGHVTSGSASRGHRFLGATKGDAKVGPRPAVVEITGADAYAGSLADNFVIADPAERRKLITEGLEAAAKDAGGRIIPDEGLVEEVSFLVEYPVVVRGSFDKEFLKLPRQVVVNAMREHQRYFSVVDDSGALLPCFLTVANTKAADMDVVRRGNERVLRARLSDAMFYFEKDLAVPLTRRAEELKGVVFQAKLGTSYEKVERFTALALTVGARLGFSDPAGDGDTAADYLGESYNPAQYDSASVDPKLYSRYVLGRSAVLAKADLVSGMVGEFPKLQGTMGSVYAERSGEVPEVATAIYEHYLPTSAGGELPASITGAIVSIADKTDTICGCFGIGQRPTGAADPYALRRSALGIISIIIDKGFELPLDELVTRSVELVGDKLTGDAGETVSAVLEFFKERFRNMLLTEGLAFDSIDSVLSAPWYELADAATRVRAIEGFKGHPACTSLVTSFKRVSNILKDTEAGATPDPALFENDVERKLFETSERISPVIEKAASAGDYGTLFETLASIKDDIDAFFDHVMVMVDDERVRANRLALLSGVRALYFRTADLSRLAM